MVKVYLAQIQTVLGNKDENLKKIHNYIENASSLKADLILFSELSLTGLSTGNKTRKLAETTEGESVKKVQEWAEKHEIKVIFGLPELENDKVYNSACFINDDGRIIGVHRKAHLWGDEEKYYTPGNNFSVWDTDIGKIGIMVCFDTQFPESARLLALKGAKIIMVPTGNMTPFELLQPFNIQSRAEENQLYICTTNLIGQEKSLNFFGGSTAVDPYGKVLVKADQSESGVIVNIQPEKIWEAREDYNYLNSRRPELYKDLYKNS